MKALRPIGHDDRLSVVDHLDELRSRLFICAGTLLVAFCLCFWQNGTLINLLNRALPSTNSAAAQHGIAAAPTEAASEHGAFVKIHAGALALGTALDGVKGVPASAQTAINQIAQGAEEAIKATPTKVSSHEKPITIGVGESFTTTLLVVGYFALLFSLPLILYQLFAFVIPALRPEEKRVAVPSMIAAPLLFSVGAVFTFFEVLPPAVHFLQGYNSKDFQILIQANTYYKFEMLMMLGIGLAFEVPLLLLALQKIGVITAKTLTLNWRYAVVLIAVIAAALPGVDPVTMFFETLPLVLLYLASIVLLKIVDHRKAKRAAAEAAAEAAALGQQFDVS
jgi:sec-independent protein translocase protein TatC